MMTNSVETVDGFQIWSQKINMIQFKTGVKNVDEILQGGIKKEEILEICGSSGSGKSKLCFKILVNIIVEYKCYCIIIDTHCNFSCNYILSNKEDYAKKRKAFAHIIIWNAFNVYQLFEKLRLLGKLLTSETYPKIEIVLIDSVSSIFVSLMGSKQFLGTNKTGLKISKINVSSGLRLLNLIAISIKSLCVKHHLSILLINDIRYEEDKMQIKAALGKMWATVPDVRLLIQQNTKNESIISVMKSTHLREIS